MRRNRSFPLHSFSENRHFSAASHNTRQRNYSTFRAFLQELFLQKTTLPAANLRLCRTARQTEFSRRKSCNSPPLFATFFTIWGKKGEGRSSLPLSARRGRCFLFVRFIPRCSSGRPAPPGRRRRPPRSRRCSPGSRRPSPGSRGRRRCHSPRRSTLSRSG